ncbi:hypothetical protein PVNG_02188 [Plasmodium vivax North Korean]|uniref:Uncharacterized protein n=1 Tax=Plasmodium vivax North Korean TaxID=1035514 RepID=A0A0J9TTN8_PLAVI|nr:hypothetical protein PVNG_02188 [Plasmodium vivax North Korean]
MCFIFYYQYPFLDKIWNLYEKFNESLEEDSYYDPIINLCDVEKDYINKNKEEYKHICRKLIRNLWSLYENKYHVPKNLDACRILNEWLHYLKKPYTIPDTNIDNLFDKAILLTPVSHQGRKCDYYSYNEKNKIPDNSIKLNYLVDNVNIISEILMNNIDPKFCYAQRFAKECKNIYKQMYTNFCSNYKNKQAENQSTCSELSTFEYTYTNYLFKLGDIKNHIPSLTTDHSEQLVGCESDKVNQERPEHPVPPQNQDNHVSSSKPITAPTVLGTMAGIPPFLALIYKVNIF